MQETLIAQESSVARRAKNVFSYRSTKTILVFIYRMSYSVIHIQKLVKCTQDWLDQYLVGFFIFAEISRNSTILIKALVELLALPLRGYTTVDYVSMQNVSSRPQALDLIKFISAGKWCFEKNILSLQKSDTSNKSS